MSAQRWVVSFSSGDAVDVGAFDADSARTRAARFGAGRVVSCETLATWTERQRREFVRDMDALGACVVGMVRS